MSFRLSTECLNEVFEYLEEDIFALHSCLLVNRLWCNVSVRILWRKIWNFRYYNQKVVSAAILSTLIACLSNESKERLRMNEIFISTPTLKSPLFNYASFCKVLSINEIIHIIGSAHEIGQHSTLLTNEIINMFMSQISSLKILIYNTFDAYDNNISSTYFPDCLTNLSELTCSSDVCSDFFSQLSQICHNIQSLTITFRISDVSNKLKKLISSQNNLKVLNLFHYETRHADIIPALAKNANTLAKLRIYTHGNRVSLSFISLFSNLQEINFTLLRRKSFNFDIFEELQYITVPKLHSLKFRNFKSRFGQQKPEYATKFLDINGKNLKEFYILNDLSLSVAKFCPNLKRLHILFKEDGLDKLKTIFNGCQYLESIEIWCGEYLNKKEVLETVAKHSPKNFCGLKILNFSCSELVPKDLESFFISWNNRIPKKSLSLFIDLEDAHEEIMKIIEKYKNLGTIKKIGKPYENFP